MSSSTALELADNTTKSIDREIENVQAEMRKVDAQIRQLNDQRTELSTRYEELKEARLRSTSKAVASERDWENGKHSVVSNCLYEIIQLLLFAL